MIQGRKLVLYTLIFILLGFLAFAIPTIVIKKLDARSANTNPNTNSSQLITESYISNSSNTPTTSNNLLIKQYGYSQDSLIEYIIQDIQTYASRTYITNLTGERLVLTNIVSNSEKYFNLLSDSINDTTIFCSVYFEDNNLYCTYNMENLLHHLNLSSNNFASMDLDQNNCKTFRFPKK